MEADPTPQDLHIEFIREIKYRLLEESAPRLKKCLKLMTEKEIWHRPNDNTVSAGNYFIHLLGNARQYIVSGIGGQPDYRVRQQEFDETGPIPAAKLIGDLDALMVEVEHVLNGITYDMLLQKKRVQGFEYTVLAILVHVVEHFSYHVGQISYIVKSTKDLDLQYYAGVDLNKTNPG